MMTNADVIYQGVKFVATAAASKGAKTLMDEFAKQFTPENLNNTQKMCVEIAKWGGATAFGAVCAQSVEAKLEKGKACYDTVRKFMKAIEEGKKTTAEPVIEVAEDINPVEIVEEEVEEDFLQ